MQHVLPHFTRGHARPSPAGKMVPFAGWSMPLQYSDSIMDSTLHCRSKASLFDVSHMCGLTLTGRDAIPFIESLVVADVAGLSPGKGTLTLLTNERGGIIDDAMVTRLGESEIYMVVNAGCRDKDLAHIEKHLADAQAGGMDVTLQVLDDRALLALQGPQAASALQGLVQHDLSSLYFGSMAEMGVRGARCLVARTGYTGEDGFELSIPQDAALAVAKALMAAQGGDLVRLCGLGARDALRLEAGLCLYGNDLDEGTSPVEAGLTWTVAPRRREKWDFLGGQAVREQVEQGARRRRVGLITGGPPARQESKVLSSEGVEVGQVTSGAHSPCLKKNVAMAYVDKALAKAGTELLVEVRGKQHRAVVTKMPFVPAHYYRG
ncbi:aminomethyltransferase folate-binding domain-containing protein [Helicosporidium sp. ATCC 50920]|nr:aminomethyltransferase folate-binding domain-containing protein [Helicosporidium sp. ATCC 50920]|eukprot:KDD72849.1 aminomethyltransferase folate-binding domain-containing protein [Helicosporidium sp. ATCC 50920]